MQIFQTSYKNEKWSADFPPNFDSPDTLLFAYFSSGMEGSQVWKELRASFPQSKLMGCSGAGEIRQSVICDREVVLTGVKFEKTKIEVVSVNCDKGLDSEVLGRNLASLFPQDKLAGVYLLSDGMAVNGTALIKGMKSVLGAELNLSGGLAGDGPNFKKTYVLVDGEPRESAISAVGFYGTDVSLISGAAGGWVPFGPVRTITKSNSNVLYELDGRPALELYKEFLGEQSKKLPGSALLFPINLKTGAEQSNRNAVRTILAVDEASQTMTFAGDVPEGTSIQLMRASQEDLVEAANRVSVFTGSKIDRALPTLSLIVSCVGRRLVMGENTENEIEEVLARLPAQTIQTGFYSYGEIASGETGFCDLHNQTMTVTLIQEMG